MLEVGQPFPSFSLQNQDGETVTSEAMKGSATIYYFYPKDDTSGCTKEACEFRDLMPRFEGAKVVGVSPDSVASHKKFVNKYSLPFTLLADTETALCQACGIWVEKSMYGKKYMGVERTTYLVDANGIITHVWRKVKPEGHAAEVQSALS